MLLSRTVDSFPLEIFQNMAAELIRIISQTLGLQDQVFNSFSLAPQTLSGMITILSELTKNPDFENIVAECLTDPMSLSRYQQRLFSMQQATR